MCFIVAKLNKKTQNRAAKLWKIAQGSTSSDSSIDEFKQQTRQYETVIASKRAIWHEVKFKNFHLFFFLLHSFH